MSEKCACHIRLKDGTRVAIKDSVARAEIESVKKTLEEISSSVPEEENITYIDNMGFGSGAKELFIRYGLDEDTRKIDVPWTHLVLIEAENEETWTEEDEYGPITYRKGKYTYMGSGSYTSIQDDSEYSGNIYTSILTGLFTLVLDNVTENSSLTFSGSGISDDGSGNLSINANVTYEFEALYDWFGTKVIK